MNSDFIRWLLDIDVIPKGSQSLRLAWEHPWPNWLWALLIAAAAVFAFWSYSRLSGSITARRALASLRMLTVLVVLVIISGPMLELPRETVEQDWVLFLVDRSESMTIKDATSGDQQSAAGTQRVSRDQQLNQTLDAHKSMLAALANERHVVWMGFDTGAFNLEGIEGSRDQGIKDKDGGSQPSMPGSLDPSMPELGSPDGRQTRLGPALDQALQRAAARPVSGVVVLSDGRTDDPPARALIRRLQADAIPVFVVPLGSKEPLGDLAVRSVDAPRRAFIRDRVPVIVELDRLGESVRDVAATVTLIDAATGEEFDRVELPAGDEREQITLTAEPELAGEATWQVIVDTTPAPGSPGGGGGGPDLIPDNNFQPVNIELVDRPLRVLFVEGYPRWEYRYVKNLLVREKSVSSSVMLISADRDFAQEGNEPITRLPRSPGEIAEYDVIVLGDVPAGFFSNEQLEMFREHVSQRGAGLLWIGGEHSTPVSYAGTALADLLPMKSPLNLPPIGVPVTITPTPLAERLGVLQLTAGNQVGWPRELSDPSYGWSRLHYAQRIEPGQLKPAAEVLAQTTEPFNGTPLPLVMAMRYGAGQSIYVATDEVWRWRFGRGELLHEQFWVQMIRMLGRESLSSAGEPARLEANPRRVAVRQPVRLELRVLDAQMIESPQSSAAVVLENVAGEKVAELELRRIEGAEDRYAATFLPEAAGELTAKIADPSFARLGLSASFEVLAPDDELRRPETDHALLANLAASTEGRVLLPAALDELPRLLPNRAVRTINPLTEPIWDTPLALGLVLILLTAEWIGRKALRLV
jgi:hypothetical protein